LESIVLDHAYAQLVARHPQGARPSTTASESARLGTRSQAKYDGSPEVEMRHERRDDSVGFT